MTSVRPGVDREAEGAAVHERAPSGELRAIVECYWSREPVGPDGPASHRVLPDGCIDIIFGFPRPPARAERSADPIDVGPAIVVGPMTRPLVVHSTQSLGFLGVRFRPGAAQAFLGVPASEITDERVALSELWTDSERLIAELSATRDETARVRVIERALKARRTEPGRTGDVEQAVRLIVESGGRIPVEEISRVIGVTRQHLARQFARHVGITPKTLSRIVRARRVIARAQPGQAVRWSTLAYDAGYFDQSHLVAEFAELTGLTPEQWLATR